MTDFSPTAHVKSYGTCVSAVSAYDGNEGTYASLEQNAVDEASFVILKGFESGIDPADLDIEILGEHRTVDTNDKLRLWFRPHVDEAFVLVKNWNIPIGFPMGSASSGVVSIDDRGVGFDSSNWQIGIMFFNGPGTPPRPPPAGEGS